MKLITEQIFDNLSVLKEEQEGKDKSLIITGVFMQAGTPNKNNRVYPLEIMKREVENYNKDYIQKNRGLGELGHPDNPVVNLAEVENKGFEFQVGYNDKIGKVGYNASVNLTTVNNNVLSLYRGLPSTSGNSRIEEGYSINYIYGYKTDGIFQTTEDIVKIL